MKFCFLFQLLREGILHPLSWHSDKSIQTTVTHIFTYMKCLQCFDAVGWVAGRASGL